MNPYFRLANVVSFNTQDTGLWLHWEIDGGGGAPMKELIPKLGCLVFEQYMIVICLYMITLQT